MQNKVGYLLPLLFVCVCFFFAFLFNKFEIWLIIQDLFNIKILDMGLFSSQFTKNKQI